MENISRFLSWFCSSFAGQFGLNSESFLPWSNLAVGFAFWFSYNWMISPERFPDISVSCFRGKNNIIGAGFLSGTRQIQRLVERNRDKKIWYRSICFITQPGASHQHRHQYSKNLNDHCVNHQSRVFQKSCYCRWDCSTGWRWSYCTLGLGSQDSSKCE